MGLRAGSPNAKTIWSGQFELPGEWAEQAVCATSGWPDAWFPEKTEPGETLSATYAKRICRTCPVQLACLDYALRHESGVYRWGIYGGLSPEQRRKLARRREAS